MGTTHHSSIRQLVPRYTTVSQSSDSRPSVVSSHTVLASQQAISDARVRHLLRGLLRPPPHVRQPKKPSIIGPSFLSVAGTERGFGGRCNVESVQSKYFIRRIYSPTELVQFSRNVEEHQLVSTSSSAPARQHRDGSQARCPGMPEATARPTANVLPSCLRPHSSILSCGLYTYAHVRTNIRARRLCFPHPLRISSFISTTHP